MRWLRDLWFRLFVGGKKSEGKEEKKTNVMQREWGVREEKLQNTQVVFMIVRCVCMLCLLLLHKFSEIMKYNVCTSWQQSQPEKEALAVGVFRCIFGICSLRAQSVQVYLWNERTLLYYFYDIPNAFLTPSSCIWVFVFRQNIHGRLNIVYSRINRQLSVLSFSHPHHCLLLFLLAAALWHELGEICVSQSRVCRKLSLY